MSEILGIETAIALRDSAITKHEYFSCTYSFNSHLNTLKSIKKYIFENYCFILKFNYFILECLYFI